MSRTTDRLHSVPRTVRNLGRVALLVALLGCAPDAVRCWCPGGFGVEIESSLGSVDGETAIDRCRALCDAVRPEDVEYAPAPLARRPAPCTLRSIPQTTTTTGACRAGGAVLTASADRTTRVVTPPRHGAVAGAAPRGPSWHVRRGDDALGEG